ncbi:Glycine cleavage system H protein [bioreactor metagenome]|uniref:Glycine cleavage system H protein n=1 Tax=bioreactor metagenome TaxID=1076179 RepID=A0A645F2Z2_9ZZZZ
MTFPENLKYSKDHEWIRVEGNIGFIGVTDHAQSELGDIAYVDIAEDTTTTTSGESFGTIEAVKAVSDLIAPVSGKVIEINTSLNDDPSVVNSDPYNAGWMIKVELSNPAELDNLMDAAAYQSFIK